MRVSWEQALSWRLRRHLLNPVGEVTVEGVVGRLGAVAAQSETADLSIGTRLARSRLDDIRQALADGRIIKTFAFRGATHLLTPTDGACYLALRAASRMWERNSWQSYYSLTAADWPRFREAVREILDEGPLTHDELGAAVTKRAEFRHLGFAFTDGAMTLLKPLAWQGDLCFGPERDGHATFQRLDSNPRWEGLPDLDDAGPAAVEAYLRAYAPATPAHVQYWLGEGLGAGRKRITGWIDGLGDRLADLEVGGEPHLVLRDDIDDLSSTRPTGVVRLLPRYDQWVLGPGTADIHVVPPAVRAEVSRGANIVVVAGVVAGTWTIRADELAVAWAAAATRPDQRALAEEVTRLATLRGAPLRLLAQGG